MTDRQQRMILLPVLTVVFLVVFLDIIEIPAVFLLVHLWNFFVPARFGDLEGVPNKEYLNLYSEVALAFKNPIYVALYVISMVALAYHLIHGFQSAFQSLGLTHKKYTPFIQKFGYAFSVIICLGFAAIPLYFFFFIEL